MKAKFICPLIVVSDIEVSRRFYENFLGQTVKVDFGENISFEGGFAIHLMSHYISLTGHSDIIFNSHSFELYFESFEMVELRDELARSGIQFIHDIVEQPWKQQVMRFYDPDGHIIEVGEPLDCTARRLFSNGWEKDQISRAMDVPPEIVYQWISGEP